MSEEAIDYNLRQKREDEAHEKAYAAWYAGLSAREKAALRKSEGVSISARMDKPYVQKPKRKRPEDDGREPRTDRHAVIVRPDMAGAVDTLGDVLAERFGVALATAEAIAAWHVGEVESAALTHKAFLFQRLIAGFIEPGNLRIRAAGLAYAANLAVLNGLGSLRNFATQNGVSPSAVSKEKRRWQKDLELPPSPHGKSEEACQNYSRSQKTKHWRNQKCKAKP